MDVSSNNMIEFGDFDTSFDQFLPDDCVQFPSSWPNLDAKQKVKLSFTIPIVDILSGENDIDSINNNVPPAKVVDASKQLAALKQSTQSRDDFVKENGVSDAKSDELNGTQNSEPVLNGIDYNSSHKDDINTNKSIDANGFTNSHAENEQLPENILKTDIERTKNDGLNSISHEERETKPAPTKSSWAGLFRNNTNNNQSAVNHNIAQKPQNVKTENDKTATQTDTNTPQHSNQKSSKNQSQNNNEKTVQLVKAADDRLALELADCIQYQELIFKPQAFIPRGLINISNWCYVNATLQALLVCPPFYQLLKNLPMFSPEERTATSTPIIDSFIRLASEFRPLSSKRGYQSNKEVRQGTPFEPYYIYDMLSVIESKLAEKGTQEDAEEFQSCILNGLHEEMTQLLSLASNDSANSPNAKSSEFEHELPYEIPLTDDVTNGVDDLTMNEWEEVVPNKKNRTAVTRRADKTRTPISEMFRGELCTSVFRTGQKVSVSYEPFFSLPLDVLNTQSWTVDDALLNLTEKEIFSSNGSENSDVIRQQTLEVLPPVLILHLKRFVYDKKGGSKKIDRKVDYKTDLVISKDILSKNARKVALSQRSYKLFAVVYHHGEKMCGGHYTTDVFHIGLSSWLRIDDQNIKPLHYQEALRHSPPKTAYILYYRRTDLG